MLTLATRKSPIIVLMFCLALVGGARIRSAGAANELTDAEFRRLLQELQPESDEPWQTIPWKADLLEAQREAATQKKPIYIWAMDGHPLGCT